MKKICFIINSFSIGGIERVIITLVNSLAKSQNVSLLVLKNTGELKETVNSNVNIIDCHNIRVKELNRPLRKYLQKDEPDYLITSIYPISILAVIAIKQTKVKTKLVVTHHALFDMENQKNFIFNFFILKLIKIFYNKAFITLAVSKGVCDFLTGIGVTNVRIMYNPIDIGEKLKNSFVEDTKAKTYGKYVLYLGRFAPVKNIDLIIKSFKKFVNQEQNRDFKLLLIGNGPEESRLKKLVEEYDITDVCFFLGSKTYPEAYIKNSELVLMASFSEAMPVTVLEAFCFNVPIVSTPARGCLDIFNSLDYKYQTNSFYDEEEYVSLMNIILIEKNSLTDLTRKVADNYGIESITKHWNELLV